MSFEPSFDAIDKAATAVLNKAVNSVSELPRIDGKVLGQDLDLFLAPSISEEVVQDAAARVSAVIEKAKDGPIKHQQLYDQYEALITRQADADIAAFIDSEEEHSFEEYTKVSFLTNQRHVLTSSPRR